MSSKELLAKLGSAAVKWTATKGGAWIKPSISAKNVARLRREALVAGEEWTYDKPAAEPAKRRRPKGHKHDREKPLREAAIQAKLAEADKRIADYRVAYHATMREASLMDRILLTPKQIRLKAKGG
ncbi:hypothetical protein C2E20_5883 [Micractinium conductrix]|uniref:Large ribosomal subunit protein mL59 domain-containing protein n=1 Tax=Micractinium conductrix TaxID=554055 RepID=A0A2P6V9B2_9CHLO|nr:hypothetical protein C2E20_5883 [Micractinium conductrix]|eukprot:PSC70680.1 hypothetical protein C2E20_5883 [Micractinium conductrix]